jgi:SP family general alpha glucoside:H+ symporter-like MFS transporter
MMTTTEKDLHPTPRPIQGPIDVDDKHDIDLIEKVDQDALPEDTIMMSPFEDMGIRKTWSAFRKCAAICLFATVSAAAE